LRLRILLSVRGRLTSLRRRVAFDEPASSSRGEQRQKYLEAFFVHQMRAKTSTKRIENAKEKKRSSSHAKDNHWWSLERMDTELGVNRAANWRNSGHLPQRPCPRQVPRNLTCWSTACLSSGKGSARGLMQITVQVSQDAVEADNELINDVTNRMDPDICAEPVAKPEKEDEAEKQLEQEAKDLEAFKSNRSWVRQFQDFQIETELLDSSARGVKYTEGLVNDIEKHKGKLEKKPAS